MVGKDIYREWDILGKYILEWWKAVRKEHIKTVRIAKERKYRNMDEK